MVEKIIKQDVSKELSFIIKKYWKVLEGLGNNGS